MNVSHRPQTEGGTWKAVPTKSVNVGGTKFVYHVINYSTEDLRSRVKHLTDGKGADVILDVVGGDVFDQCVRCVNMLGRVIVMGFTWPDPDAGYELSTPQELLDHRCFLRRVGDGKEFRCGQRAKSKDRSTGRRGKNISGDSSSLRI